MTQAANLSALGSNVTTAGNLSSASSLSLQTSSTEQIRITSTGGVSFGATGTAYGTSGQVLTSNGNAPPTWQTPASPSAFPAGTALTFVQTAAPTGWTKSTTHDNKALRVVSGTASSGGTVAFTTAFASQTPAGSVSITAVSGSAGATTLTTPQIPSHTHTVGGQGTTANSSGKGANYANPSAGNTGPTGGGGSHTHPFSFTSGTGTFTGTAIDLAVQYVDIIIATKD